MHETSLQQLFWFLVILYTFLSLAAHKMGGGGIKFSTCPSMSVCVYVRGICVSACIRAFRQMHVLSSVPWLLVFYILWCLLFFLQCMMLTLGSCWKWLTTQHVCVSVLCLSFDTVGCVTGSMSGMKNHALQISGFACGRGVGTAGATGALAPAMLKPWDESIFSPPQYFLTFLHAVP